MAQAATVRDPVEHGRRAFARGAWDEARASFEAALERDESPALLEELSWAAWWQEDAAACIAARERAYRGYRAAGDTRGAARMAIWLSDDHHEFHGDDAVSNGWFQRATRLLDGLDPCPEQGWLIVFSAFGAISAGHLEEGRKLAVQACEFGHELGVSDLEMFSLAAEGLALVSAGAVPDGLARLDEAVAAALGGDYEQLVLAGWTCCLMIDACERVRDYDRAAQWCQKVEEFSRARRIDFVRGRCRAYYGAIVGWHGDWTACERELAEAMRHMHETRPAWRAEATVRLGDLRRRQGRFAEAEELYAQVEWHEMARMGRAALALERGDPAGAHDILDRMLEPLPVEARLKRAGALELIVHAEAALGRERDAQEHLDELRAMADDVPTPALCAAVSAATGTLAAASGRHADARRAFADALDRYGRAEAPWDAARVRLALAEVLAELGSMDAASHEAESALRVFAELGAATEEARARGLLRRLGVPPGRGAESLLTARELQVLDCVARGLSDRAIAAELTISDHTVHRHVANIYAKLGCSTRGAAVAQAHRLQLL
jgi:LuxR family transcriptional regulator, maltose regulon positive regulatory protein